MLPKKKTPFSAEEDEMLIEHVSFFEYIWNMKDADIADYKKDKVWQDIAEQLGRKRDECQTHWKSIRDHYKRQKKEDIGTTGFAANKKRASYWNRLSFLDTIEDERKTFSNISADTSEILENNNELLQDIENHPPSSKDKLEIPSVMPTEPVAIIRSKRKTRVENSALSNYLKEKKIENTQLNDTISQLTKCEEEDEIDLFFKTIAKTVKKFSPKIVRKTKLKVLEIVSDMEQLHEQVHVSTNHTSSSNTFRNYQSQLPIYSFHHTSNLTCFPNYQSPLSVPSPHRTLNLTSPDCQSELSNHSSHYTLTSPNYQSELSNHSSHHTSNATSPNFQSQHLTPSSQNTSTFTSSNYQLLNQPPSTHRSSAVRSEILATSDVKL
ncbi:uncharacterized protein LOC126746993 [Anthonomus grandis grandis]|uniref:uncharacterized protein LOC126746993 n=1 Tax=Anthonomus grandis grandis TaxID=2921223 RepID=UPI00216532F6|nr:uncharacterized protein LOC126746993 [Anthonomus grandis grandis]